LFYLYLYYLLFYLIFYLLLLDLNFSVIYKLNPNLMKTLKIFLPLVLVCAVFYSCQKDETESLSEIGQDTDPRDGIVYKTVTIGNQVWMAENLAYAPSSGNYWAYDNDNSNVETYGYLYDWQTARNVCPNGWHLPSDAEWTELTDFLGGVSVAGDKLKKAGTTWGSYEGTTNESGFTALPGGRRGIDYFDDIGIYGAWWSATQNGSHAWMRGMFSNNSYVDRGSGPMNHGFSVRCVKD
jgi:uncharacterized protein (TIGR02145 family)